MCGPEGPIIHIGACIGAAAPPAVPLRACRPLFRAFALRNDLDQRDFVAIAGAGVAAAFMAPLSATLFVVEEAAALFGAAALARLLRGVRLDVRPTYIDRLRSGGSTGAASSRSPSSRAPARIATSRSRFRVRRRPRRHLRCRRHSSTPGGLRRWRRHPRRQCGARRAGGVCLFTHRQHVRRVSAALPCVPRSVGQLEYAHFDGSNPGGCAPPYGQCGGDRRAGRRAAGPDWTWGRSRATRSARRRGARRRC